MKPHVSAVIVTYNCGPAIADTLAALQGQVQSIYVVDNGSDAVTTAALAAQSGITLIQNPANLGIAAAQNQGIAKALEAGAEWVLLLDHDSIPATNMVSAMLAARRELNNPNFAIVAPFLTEQGVPCTPHYLTSLAKFGFRRKRLARGEILTDALVVIASGSLIQSDVFRRIGLMREEFFIDAVDYEFCLRARKAGYRILVTGSTELIHHQGRKTRTFGIVTANYSPERQYYTFRNRLWLLRLHGRNFPFLFFYETLVCLCDIARIILLENQKPAKLREILRGLRRGFKPI